MNPGGSADRIGWVGRSGPPDRRNRWCLDPAVPPPMMRRNFRNDGLYNDQSNSFWSGPWMFPRGPFYNGQHSRQVPQQVFRQHQPFGNTEQHALAGAYPFPPPAHVPQHFYFGTRRSNGRIQTQRQFPHTSPHDYDINGSNGAASGSQHLDRHHRFSDARTKSGNGVKGKRKQQWRKKMNRGGESATSCREEKVLDESANLENGALSIGGQSSSSLNFSCENGELKNSESLYLCHNENPRHHSRRAVDKEIVSKICDTNQSEEKTDFLANDGRSYPPNKEMCQFSEEDKYLYEDGAVGGVGISVSNKEDSVSDSMCFQSDKDLVDEGAICDFDGLFQNQEYFQDHYKKDSHCNDNDENSDSNLCCTDRKGDVLSEDSESEKGAYGGLSSSIHSIHNGFYNGGDKTLNFKCNGHDGLSENVRHSSYENKVEWMKDSNSKRVNGDVLHSVSNGNMNDSCDEDNGDFIDTDLPSCNNHILSSSDEMENLSSDDGGEREERTEQLSISPVLFNSINGDLKCNGLSTVQHNILNAFEHLSLRRGAPVKTKSLCENQCCADEAEGNSSCDSKIGNKNLFYSKHAKYLSENSDSDCENCDVSHTCEVASQPSQTVLLYPTVTNPLPVIGAAASTSTLCRGEKILLADHPGADGESFPPMSQSQSQCFHSDIDHSLCMSSSKAREASQQYVDNQALSASSEQWDVPFSHPNLPAVHDPASGPSFFEGSASCFHEHYINPINDLGGLSHHNTGHLANGLCADTGANFIDDESNQHQKVFLKKSMEEKMVTEASYSASSIDGNEMGTGSDPPESNSSRENGHLCVEELLTPDSVDMVLLPMEEEIEPVHFMADFCPSGGSGSGDEEGGGQSPSFHPSMPLLTNVHAVSSALSCDDCHCAFKDLTPKLINRLPSNEFYDLIKSVSASDSCMRFFDKDGKDITKNSLNVKTDDNSEQITQEPGSKSDRLRVDRVMIWNEYEAYVVQYKQIAVSACGQTAVLNVMKALKFSTDKSAVCKVIKTTLRKEDKDIPEYLFSRACAGTTATELKEGVEKLSGGAVGGRFFHFWPPRKVKLLHWLAYWMKRGAIPVATLNLQQGPHPTWELPDSWHHQMVYGVGDQGLYLTNPLEIVSERSAMNQLCSDSVLLVRRQDVVSRFQETTDLSQLLDHPDPRWLTMNVLGQVVNILRECNMPSMPGHCLQMTSHLCIPASFQAGIMLFMPKDKGAWNSLMAAPDLPLEDRPIPNA